MYWCARHGTRQIIDRTAREDDLLTRNMLLDIQMHIAHKLYAWYNTQSYRLIFKIFIIWIGVWLNRKSVRPKDRKTEVRVLLPH